MLLLAEQVIQSTSQYRTVSVRSLIVVVAVLCVPLVAGLITWLATGGYRGILLVMTYLFNRRV